jgi:hypothetical protein
MYAEMACPAKKASMAMSMVKDTGVCVSMKPVAPAAMSPQIKAGVNCADTLSGDKWRNSSRKRHE